MNREDEHKLDQQTKSENERPTVHSAPERPTHQPERIEPQPEYDSFMRIIRR